MVRPGGREGGRVEYRVVFGAALIFCHARPRRSHVVSARRFAGPRQAALRFFQGARVTVTFVTCAASRLAGELRRLRGSGSAPAVLLDTDGRQYKDAGLAYMGLATTRSRSGCSQKWAVLLRLPLVRSETRSHAARRTPRGGAWLAGTAK